MKKQQARSKTEKHLGILFSSLCASALLTAGGAYAAGDAAKTAASPSEKQATEHASGDEMCQNNSCKGHSDCAGYGNDNCAGSNECKGHGSLKAKDEKECMSKKGLWHGKKDEKKNKKG